MLRRTWTSRFAMRWLIMLASLATLALIGPSGANHHTPDVASAATVPSGFRESVVFAGLTNPTVIRFAADGRVFCGEERSHQGVR